MNQRAFNVTVVFFTAFMMLTAAVFPAAGGSGASPDATKTEPERSSFYTVSCPSHDDSKTATAWELTNVPNHNIQLRAYGKIFYNATSSSRVAREKARKDLATILSHCVFNHGNYAVGQSYFDSWLSGVNVQMAFATAMVLGGQGELTEEIHYLLLEVASLYQFNRDGSCGSVAGNETSNLCMDDYSQRAVAQAWMAAYYSSIGDTAWRDYYVVRAKNALKFMLSGNPATGFCIMNLSTNQCTGSYKDIGNEDPAYELVAFNHNQETMGYGIGLMTSVSSAVIGLETAKGAGTFAFNEEQLVIAKELFLEGVWHSLDDGSIFATNDPQTGLVTGNLCYNSNLLGQPNALSISCGENSNVYKPKMFPVAEFYDKKVWSSPDEEPQSGFAFDTYDTSLFSPNVNFFSYGRKAIYIDIACNWWKTNCRPALQGWVGPTVSIPKLIVSYYGVNGTSLKTITNGKLDHEVSFIFDDSLGRFEQRPGPGPCALPVENPSYVKIRVNTNGRNIVGCQIRDCWTNEWTDFSDPVNLNIIRNEEWAFINTDTYETDLSLPGCPPTSQQRFTVGTNCRWEVRLTDDDGNEFYRTVTLKRIAGQVQ